MNLRLFFTDVLKGAEKQAEELKQYGVEVLFFYYQDRGVDG